MNIFNEKCRSFYVAFDIKDENDLDEIFEQILKDQVEYCTDFKIWYEDIMYLIMPYIDTLANLIYRAGVYCLERSKQFVLFWEKSDTHYYFTVLDIPNIDKEKISHIVKANQDAICCFAQDGFSLKIPLFSNKKPKIIYDEIFKQPVLHTYSFISGEDLLELNEYLQRLESASDMLRYAELKESEVVQLGDALHKLSSILSIYNETYAISSSLKDLSKCVNENYIGFCKNSQKLTKIFMIFFQDLKEWQSALFVKGAPSANFLDATIISNIEAIKNLITPLENRDNNELDDIFEF
ncbi:MAG: hypothetical protein RL154_585 [Pseudomonadota bacterium]|jgi:sulfur relay (sulfurtransferase) DsrC/TusE family protein